ncbi:DUF1573 domain-containing protein [Lutibacter sp. B1]|uniref:DUF1573 domain-containing protein n=1 Tax=Lutibacter sp. B1 TaxID=2725996 RepID=UPI0014570286|nr:DUF1573 domain-containing protein [Lutibacter sp. B1]NLP56991.1 DUF1573 domain-containing protein [Lutibacter sp. B1]
MRKIVYLGLACAAFFMVSCKENASSKIKASNIESAKERDAKISLGGAIIDFDKREYDFGSVTEGDVVEGIFVISNKGKADLIILDAKASCGCTVPEWPKEAIKPGDSAELKFSFNSRGRSGKQSKSITLQTNSEKATEILRISGTVIKKS